MVDIYRTTKRHWRITVLAELIVGSISAALTCLVFPPSGEGLGLISLTAAGNRAQINQFRYIKIQPKTIELSTTFWGINPTNSVVIPRSLVLRSIVLG